MEAHGDVRDAEIDRKLRVGLVEFKRCVPSRPSSPRVPTTRAPQPPTRVPGGAGAGGGGCACARLLRLGMRLRMPVPRRQARTRAVTQ
eukprot:scaffold1508_cov320-Prasinococcus_capsulatus_cf.AAC.4